MLDALFPARPGDVSAIRHAVTDAAAGLGADETLLMRIELAVSEAATNAIVHAYRDRVADDWSVRVMLEETDGRLLISVRDDGVGMQPRVDSPGLGLGLSLMAREADRFEVRAPPGGGTEIALRFDLTAAVER